MAKSSIGFNFLRLVSEDRREYEFENNEPQVEVNILQGIESKRLVRIYNLLLVFYFILRETKYPLSKNDWVKSQIAKHTDFATNSQGFRKDFATFWQLVRSFFANKIIGPNAIEMIQKYPEAAKAISKNDDLMQKPVKVTFTNGKRLIKNRMTPTEVKMIHRITGLDSPNRDTMSYLLWCVKKTK